ncbi:MAG TPA: serine/threonine-protein kinase [Polyangia bacterium]|jgi:serine/threonine-protein kinase
MVDQPAEASKPPLVLGRYRLGAQLGQGGMGRVHAAADTRLPGRKVAVKTLVLPDVAPDMKAQLTERFKREPEILSLIKHKHVVGVLDHGCDADGTLYLVTELLEGDNLNQHLHARGEPFPIAQAADLALELCAGIEACHANGVIHRDLKPDNVFLVKAQAGSGLEVKIIDFGLAKGQHAQRITRAGIVPGTIRFFSPEQAAGDEATEQSDQYSLALCLYFCLTGHEPYDQLQGNPMELIRAISSGEFPRPSGYRELPPSLEAIVLRAMHREPARRFPAVRDLGQALWPFAGAAHQELWRSEYGPDAERLPAPPPAAAGTAIPAEGAGASSWWQRLRRRRR